MPDIDRRGFLAGAGALVAAPGAIRRPVAPRGQPSPAPFAWGVASFDPTPSSVLLWARHEPPPDGVAVQLRWVLAADEALADVRADGSVIVDAATGWCARVDVDGLPPGGVWWYAFTAPSGARSPVGRTRTMPDDPGRLRVAAVSCSRFAAAGFAAYRALAEREVDVVVHLGDYIYEDGADGRRAHDPPRRLRSLDDYRLRYAQHRGDPDLQAVHARHPMVAIWDDHEISGNAWRDGAPDHDEVTDGPWATRREAATAAHDEWLPGRTDRADDGRVRAWRSVPLGGLAELIVLDTRQWGRERQARTAAEVTDGARRSMLGDDQMAFVAERLSAPDLPPWVLVANQVMLHPLRVPVPTESLAQQVEDAGFLVVDGLALNPDQWDGYPEAREELSVAIGGRGGTVILTGDVHSSWAWEGPANDGGRPTMVEIVAPAVSSTPFADRLPIPAVAAEAALLGVDDDLSFVEIQSHGYVIVDLTPERVQAEWWFVDPEDAGSERFAAARQAPVTVPMHLSEVADPTENPAPTTSTSSPTTSVAARDAPAASASDDDGLPAVAVGGAVAAAAAGVAAAVAVRRRRT